MPRQHDDDSDDDFDPEEYGWTSEEWEELKELYGYEDMDDADFLADFDFEDYAGYMDELDYMDDLDNLGDDDDFYS